MVLPKKKNTVGRAGFCVLEDWLSKGLLVASFQGSTWSESHLLVLAGLFEGVSHRLPPLSRTKSGLSSSVPAEGICRALLFEDLKAAYFSGDGSMVLVWFGGVREAG